MEITDPTFRVTREDFADSVAWVARTLPDRVAHASAGRRAVVGGDEAEALVSVEPLNGAGSHIGVLSRVGTPLVGVPGAAAESVLCVSLRCRTALSQGRWIYRNTTNDFNY